MRIRKLFKYLLRFLGALLLLALGAALLVPYLVDPADHLDGALAEVTAATGLVIEPQGRMRLSLLPWVGVDTGPLAISAAGSDEPLALLDNARIRLEYAPLVSGEIVLHSAHIQGLTLHVGPDPALPEPPAADLAGGDASAAPVPSQPGDSDTAGSMDFKITDGLVVTNSAILYADADGAMAELRLDRLELGPVDLHLAENAVDLALEGRVLAPREGWDSSVALSAVLVLDAALGNAGVRDLDLDLAVAGPDLPGLRAQLQLMADLDWDAAASRLAWQDLLLLAPATRLSSNGTLDLSGPEPAAQGLVSLTSVPRDLLHALGMDAVVADPQALRDLRLDFHAALADQVLEITELAGNLDQTACSGQMRAQFGPEPSLCFYLSADRLDLDRYLGPGKAEDESGMDLSWLASLAAMDMDGVVEVEELVLESEAYRQVRWTLTPQGEDPAAP